jgi:hypothetical protein
MITFRFPTSLLLLFTSTMGVTACTHAWQSSDAAPIVDKPRVYSARQVITKSEIDKAHVSTTYDLLVVLRPEFLSSPAARKTDGSVFPPVVYINGLMAGDVASLRGISASMIAEIRYLPPRDATTYHGESHRGGEIMVYTYHPRDTQPPM